MKHILDLSIILPVFNEEENVASLVDELMEVLPSLVESYEVIAINVPGRDNSYEQLEKLGDTYEHFYPVNLKYLQTKGYQKGYQYMFGYRHSRGKKVIQMDSDYQDDPNDIAKFLKKLDEGFDLVVGWKQDRKDPFFYKLTSWGQNLLTRLVTKVAVHDKNCGFKAFSRPAVDALVLYGMNYRDIPMQLSAKGFSVTEVPINNRKRKGGTSNFNFMNRLIGGTLDFSAALIQSLLLDKPFRFLGGIGITFGSIGVLIVALITGWLLWSGGLLFNMNWWIMWWFAIGMIMCIMGTVFFVGGILAEYVRGMQKFDVREYYIIDDPKDLTKR